MPDRPGPSLRAGLLATGSELLQGTIADANGPWLARKLADAGFDLVGILAVADRRDDMEAGLRHLAGLDVDLLITSGGLGPTADDLTAEVVASFCGRELRLDRELEGRIRKILNRFSASRPGGYDSDALDAANRKQAMVPDGAVVLEPVGTAPGLIVPPAGPDGPLVLVLPGPPRELQPMWRKALEEPLFRELLDRTPALLTRHLRMFGTPESELALALREIEADGLGLDDLEITTCLRDGEVEIDLRYRSAATDPAGHLVDRLQERFPRSLYSLDGTTVDEEVAGLLAGHRLALAESCSAGLLAARITDRPGASEYFAGGVVSYSNQAKQDLLGVDPDLLQRHGAVSAEVAEAMARGALERFGADVAVAVTGIAGPDGGSPEKPVGLVHFAVLAGDGPPKLVAPVIPGGRRDIRERAALVGMHLLRRQLRPR